MHLRILTVSSLIAFVAMSVGHLGPVSRKTRNFSGDIILCIFKTKVFRVTKLRSYFNFYSVYDIKKDQLYRISGSKFYEWLFGPVKFSGLLRSARLGRVVQSLIKLILDKR